MKIPNILPFPRALMKSFLKMLFDTISEIAIVMDRRKKEKKRTTIIMITICSLNEMIPICLLILS